MSVFARADEGRAAPITSASWKFVSFLKRAALAISARRAERRLRLCEMLSLGEKRFVAVIEYGADKFVLAGTAQRISLLKSLRTNGDDASEEETAPRSGQGLD